MKIVFMGTPDFAVSIADALYESGHEIVLCVSQPDKPKGRSGELQFPDVKKWAVERDIPVFQPERIRRPEAIEELKKYPADIAVVAAFGQILPEEILNMYPYGCVNVHASLLPKYRGAAPIQWAVINGEATTGVTTMQMGVGLDDGDILLQKEIEIASDETGGGLFDKLAVLGGQLITETLEGLEQGTITPIPQNESEATHVGMIKKELGRIDFDRPAVEVEYLIRGLNPWPSAYTSLSGKTLKLWKAEVIDGDNSAFVSVSDGLKSETTLRPGTIVGVDSDAIYVACNPRILKITELQLEGKKRMSTADFLRGRSVETGGMLG